MARKAVARTVAGFMRPYVAQEPRRRTHGIARRGLRVPGFFGRGASSPALSTGRPAGYRRFLPPMASPMTPTARRWNLVAALAVAVAFGGLCSFVFAKLAADWDWSKPWQYRGLLMRGWWCTLLLSGGALIGSLVVGVLLML